MKSSQSLLQRAGRPWTILLLMIALVAGLVAYQQAVTISTIRSLEDQGLRILAENQFQIHGDDVVWGVRPESELCGEITNLKARYNVPSLNYISGLEADPRLSVEPVFAAEIADLLPRLTEVKYISLSHSQISDGVCESLAELPNLTYLDLAASNLSDEQLQVLSKCPSLKVIDVFQSDVTGQGLEQFHAIRPDVKVHNWYH